MLTKTHSNNFIQSNNYPCKSLPFTLLKLYGHKVFDGDMWSRENQLPTGHLHEDEINFPIELKGQTQYCRVKLKRLKSFLNDNTTQLFAIPIIYTAMASGNDVGDWLEEFVENYLIEYDNVHLVFYNGSDLYGITSPYILEEQKWRGGKHFDRETYLAQSLKSFPKHRLHFYLCNLENLNLLHNKIPEAHLNFFSIFFSQIVDTVPIIKDLNYTNKQRKYNVISLNSRVAPHRDEVVDTLSQYQTAIYSYRYKNIFLQNTPWDQELKPFVEGRRNLDAIEFHRPQDHNLMRQYQNTIPNHISDYAYFYICTETDFYQNDEKLITKMWFTEKALKSFVYKWPMLMVGNCYVLKALRTLGFETFPEIFNEKYDYVENTTSRMHWIQQEIKKICEMPIQEAHQLYHSNIVQQKLNHNKNHFFVILKDMDINDLYKKLNLNIRV